MLFALKDFIDYLHKRGKYNLSKDPIMKYGFTDSIPKETLEYMRTGDTIFMYTSDSLVSWAIMYFTNARMSHVVNYIGNGFIMHVTTRGVIKEPIENIFGKDKAFIILQPKISNNQREELLIDCEKLINARFSWNLIFFKFINTILGRDKPYYRLQFILDVTFTLILLDLLPYLIFHKIIFIWLIVPYLFIVCINILFRKWDPNDLNIPHAKPIGLYRGLRQLGARQLLCINEE